MLEFKNKKITVMGLGLHGGGLSVTKFLAKQGAKVTVTDLKSKKQLEPSIKKLKAFKIKYVLGRHRAEDFKKVDMIIQNPGVPRNSKYLLMAQKAGVPIETDLSLFFKLCPSESIIGITGTKGKSTTTTLIYDIIRKYKKDAVIGGNIRISPLESLNKIKNNTPVILELSSWQLEGLGRHKLSPKYALITNVLRDHLNTYEGMADYVKAKELIFKNQNKSDIAILNKKNEITKKMGSKLKANKFWFALTGPHKGTYLQNEWLVFDNGQKKEKILNVKSIKLPGEHNLNNILAAVCLAKVYGVPNKIIKNEVENFKGIKDRLELIREFKGIKYVNDTTATAPDAVIASLNSFKEPIVLLAGGTDKKLEFKKMAKEIKDKAKALILFEGTASEKIAQELRNINYNKTLIFVDSMKEAFAQAKYILEKGDIFLLSPGAASFGMFINEFDRGEQFIKQVKMIK